MFSIFFIVWALAVFCNKFYFTFMKVHKRQKIKGTIRHQWITKLIYSFYFMPFILPPLEYFLVKRQINYFISFAAAAVYVMGWMLSLWAMRTMDRYWTIEIEIRDQHPLIKKGPYRFMRHPHYLFTYLEFFCLPLVANAWWSLALIALIYIPILSLRIHFEEKEMIQKFGKEYLEYRKQVWGLFPLPLFKKGVKNEV
jgi:protein-S-isoprenylcysteine O-methyltransferase Ste14